MSMEQRMQEALKVFEIWANTSGWCKHHKMEPRIGDLDCPVEAEQYGMARQSFLTVFICALEARKFGCRFEECRGFSSRNLEGALKHLRQLHFDHKPFHCSSDGNTW
jgi:hypothetical protein